MVWQRAPFLALCSPFDTFVGPLPTVLSAGLVRGYDSFDGYSFESELLFLFAAPHCFVFGLVRGDDSSDGYSFEIELLFFCDCSCIKLSRLVKAPSFAGSFIMVCKYCPPHIFQIHTLKTYQVWRLDDMIIFAVFRPEFPLDEMPFRHP